MLVWELRQRLLNLGPDEQKMRVVVAGYETGYDDVEKLVERRVYRDKTVPSWMGQYEEPDLDEDVEEAVIYIRSGRHA